MIINPGTTLNMELPFFRIADLLQQAVNSLEPRNLGKFTLHIYPTDIHGYQVITERSLPPIKAPYEEEDSISLPSLTPSMKTLTKLPDFYFDTVDITPTSPPPSLFQTMMRSRRLKPDRDGPFP